ncbi:MAG: CHAT domain-containing protein, partial [Verrucomicrobia bacterium]|nr:CHAT domain-containing protein [Verrucomicrobiota bacterium]
LPGRAEAAARARTEVERLESQLARRSGALQENRRSLGTSLEAVQEALPPGAALVEYTLYDHWLGRGRTEPRFGAILLGRTGAPRWVELGPATGKDGIHPLIARWQDAIRAITPPSDSETTNLLQALHDRLWRPVEKALPAGEREIIISPDASVGFVPFAALWRDGHFLGEDYLFRQVSSGRDLLARAEVPRGPRSALILAGPEYGRPVWKRSAGSVAAAGLSLLGLRPWRDEATNELPVAYGPLPNARLEGERIAALARQHRFHPVEFPPGRDASKPRLHLHRSPYLLHLATHGTFLPDPEPLTRAASTDLAPPIVLPRSPMLRSWVALAGANETLAAWRHELPEPSADGLLTAAEAATLDLSSTWLVSLSACDTGLGSIRPGEGLFGLRRGFALAGARHVLLTLWPVADKSTRELMEAFYREALPSGDAAGSLARTQRKFLEQWRKSEGPARAARWAGPFILSSRGR